MYFDFDGANRKTNDVHYTRWIDEKRVGTAYTMTKCIAFPTDFITDPIYLFSYKLLDNGRI